MNVDLDKLLIDLPPWDLTLTIDGGRHRVREVSDQEMTRVSSVAAAAATSAELVEFVRGMFETAPPAVERWTAGEISAAFAAVFGYWQARLQRLTINATAAGLIAGAKGNNRHFGKGA